MLLLDAEDALDRVRLVGDLVVGAFFAEDSDKARQKLAKEQMDFRKRQLDAAEAAAKADKTQSDAAERQENCKQARSYLQALESGMRITRGTDKGEREFLDDQGREQEIISARRAVASSCN